MPPSSTNTTEYPTYQQQRNTLGPPQTPQNPLSPAMNIRNQLTEQQWSPHPPRQTSHVSNINGPPLNVMDQNQIPTSQGIPSTQTLPPSSALSNSNVSNDSGLTANFGNKDLRTDVNKPPISMPEMPTSQVRDPTPQNVPISSQSDFSSVQSPTTSLPDKFPSSTTNTDLNLPTSGGNAISSHPPTPTPSSTTDDNVTNTQDVSLPSNDCNKPHDEISNTNSSSQQPTQSQTNTTNSFTDFNCVSSMSGYPSQPTPPKTNKMDDLVQSNVPMFSQDNSVSQDSLPDMNKELSSNSLQAPQTQTSTSVPTSTAQTNVNQTQQNHLQTIGPTSQPQTTSVLSGQVTGSSMSAMSMMPNSQQHPNMHNQGQTQPPMQGQSSISNVAIPTNNMAGIPSQGNIQSAPSTQIPAVPSHGQMPPVPQHAQSGNLPPHTNITNMAPNNQTPVMYDQNTGMLGPNGMPLGAPRGMAPGLPHGIPPMGHPGMTINMGHPMIPNMNTGHGMMPGPDIGYQPPISHHQERAALQQQLQELYCMPPAPEHQEKIAHLQERLNILSQHEATDQCNGGPQCVLQSPLFTSPMIDSPQVSSTTGRGRGKGAPRTKKPRQKKGEKVASPVHMSPNINMMMPSQQLPVSEDCVTPGAGLNIPSSEMSEITELSVDPITGEFDDKKKLKTPRKPREPKKPKEPKIPKETKAPKSPKEKLTKERKKREPKDPKVKRKYVRKKKLDGSEESATDESFNKTYDNEHQMISSEVSAEEHGDDSNTPDSGDIMESGIPEEIQADSSQPADMLRQDIIEIEVKKDEYAFEDQPTSPQELGEIPRKHRKTKPGAKKVISSKAKNKSGLGKSRKRKGMVQDSDGEGEDLASTPPPSPPEDPENAIHKRRSARNTQRKKYIDDVMLRFSDEESPIVSNKNKKSGIPSTPPVPLPVSISGVQGEENSGDGSNKMNFVYVNTTEEDSMVVQHILTSRIVKKPRKT
jgi:chromodomain-helicase-DNA-binding protein 7